MTSKCHEGFFRFPRESSVDRMTKQMENRESPAWFLCTHTTLTSWAWEPCASSSIGLAREVTMFGRILFSTLLTFLIILSFNLCYVSRVWWVNRAWTQTTVCVCVCSSLRHICNVHIEPHHKVLVDFQCMWIHQDSTHIMSTAYKAARTLEPFKAFTSIFKSDSSVNIRRKWYSMKSEWSRKLVMFCTSQPAHRLTMTQKGRLGNP